MSQPVFFPGSLARIAALALIALLAALGLALSLLWAAPAYAGEQEAGRPEDWNLTHLPAFQPSSLPALQPSIFITATKTYTLSTDSDGDNQADPGDVLSYTIVITNDGGTTATGLTLSDTLDANLSQLGLASVSPVAFDDSYNTSINPVSLSVADGASDLFANDYPGLNPAATGLSSFGGGSLGGTVTSNASGSTVNFGVGGSLTVNANGSFNFTPASGFQGVFSFTYRLQNLVGPADGLVRLTADAPPTVTTTNPANGAINVNGASNITLNFSENVAIAAGGITLGCPGAVSFSSIPALPASGITAITLDPTANLPGNTTCTVTVLAASTTDSDAADPPNQLDGDNNGIEGDNYSFSFQIAPTANDDSFNVTPHLTLNSASSVRANDDPTSVTITGFGNTLGTANGTVPNGTNFITAGGAGGRVVLNADGTFRYLPDAGDTNTSATFFYTITGGDTAQVTLSLQNTELVWFVDDNAAGTTCTGSNAGTQACPLATLTGAAAVDTASDTLFIIQGSYTCGVTLETSERVIGDGSSSDLPTLTGITPVSGSSFPTFSGTDPTLSNASGDCLTLGSGNTIRGLTIGDTSATGSDITGTNFGTLAVTETTLNGAGRALNLNNGTFNATLDGLTSTSGTNNVNLTSVGGTANLGSGTLSGATGTAFNVSGGNAAITYNGTVAKSSAGRLVDIQSRSGGSVTLGGNLTCNTSCTGINIASNTGGTLAFSSAAKTLNTGANTAITLSSNTGATVNFTGGGLGVTTTSGNGFSVTGGGIITVQGTGNTLASTTGTALNVANTTIGASGLTFQSITSNGGSNTGIILNTTGSSGGLTVTGTGSAGSGGTIANKTGANGGTATGVGIYLNSTGPVSLARMQMNDFQNFAILGNTVASFILRDSVINGVSGTVGAGNAGTNPTSRESVIFITDLSGSSGILNSTISGGATDNIRFIKNSGTLNLTITGNTIQNNDNTNGGIGEDGIFISTEGSSSLFANIANNTFANHHGDHVSASGNGTSQLHVTINNNGMTADGGVTEDFDNNGIVGDDLGGTILVAGNGSADVFFDVSNNTMFGAVVTAITINQSAFTTAAASLSGRVQNNTIGNAAITDSGSAQGSGIAVDAQGASAGAGLYKIIISVADNDIFEYNNHGLLLASGDGSSALAATATSNIINNPGTFGTNGIHLNHGKTSTPAGGGGADSQTGCFDIRANNIVGAGSVPNGATDFRLRQRINTTVQLVGYTGGASDTAAVIAYVQGLNTGVETGQATVSGTGGGFINTPSGANCLSPTLPTVPPAP